MNEESHWRADRRESSSFNESHVGDLLKHDDLDAGYRLMAADSEREAEAADWVEGTSEVIVHDECAKCDGRVSRWLRELP